MDTSAIAGRHSLPHSHVGIGLRSFRNRFPHLAARSTQNVGRFNEKDDAPPWLMPAWNFLHLVGTSTQPLEAISDKCGIDIERAADLLTNAETLHSICTERGRQVQRIEMIHKENTLIGTAGYAPCWPKKPRCAGLHIAEQFAPDLATLAKANRERVRHILGIYVAHIWRTKYFPVFHDPSDPSAAILYLQFLKELGITKSDIYFLFFSRKLRSRNRAEWKCALSLNWRHSTQLIYCKPPYRSSVASERWLAIVPAFGGRKYAPDLTKGFHFLMVMAAMFWGFNSPDQDRQPLSREL